MNQQKRSLIKALPDRRRKSLAGAAESRVLVNSNSEQTRNGHREASPLAEHTVDIRPFDLSTGGVSVLYDPSFRWCCTGAGEVRLREGREASSGGRTYCRDRYRGSIGELEVWKKRWRCGWELLFSLVLPVAPKWIWRLLPRNRSCIVRLLRSEGTVEISWKSTYTRTCM